MSSQSAIQVISPAVERTRQFLFRPFRVGRFFKLTLVAALTAGASGGLNWGGHLPSDHSQFPESPQQMPHIEWQQVQPWLLLAAIGLVVVMAVIVLISYLLIRLRFSYFDCVLRQQDQIGTAWDIYHRQAVRYLMLTVLIGLGFWVALIPIGYAIYEHFKPLFALLVSGQTADLWTFLPLMATVIPVFFLLALIVGLVHLVLNCFVLPRMALEDATMGDALSDVWSDIRIEPGQFLLFALFRFLLGMAGSLIGVAVLVLPFLVLAGIAAVLVLAAKAASTALALVVGIPLGILLVGLFIFAAIGVAGTMATFQRNYALLFYGGRYPLLGSMLPPPPPPRVWQPAYVPPPSPAPGV